MKINIKVKKGFWQVNGKPLKECNFMEREFMNNYFRELKYEKSHQNLL